MESVGGAGLGWPPCCLAASVGCRTKSAALPHRPHRHPPKYLNARVVHAACHAWFDLPSVFHFALCGFIFFFFHQLVLLLYLGLISRGIHQRFVRLRPTADAAAFCCRRRFIGLFSDRWRRDRTLTGWSTDPSVVCFTGQRSSQHFFAKRVVNTSCLDFL